MQWGYFKTKISSVTTFRWCIAHANSMCARGFITVQNLCPAWVTFMTTHFLYPKIKVSAWIFKDFSLLLKKGYLRQSFVKFLQQLNDYSENDLVLKFVDDFLASCYASLTTESSHFVWSIIRETLTNFNKIYFFGISMKSSICLWNLRIIWDGGLTDWGSWQRMTRSSMGWR